MIELCGAGRVPGRTIPIASLAITERAASAHALRVRRNGR
jgi:hypothetical protein